MSQPARRMNSELSATIALLASGVLHGLLFFGLVRSASGAERSWDELDPARFAGNTFEIDTVDAPALSRGHAAEPVAPTPEGASPPAQTPSAPEPAAPPDPPEPAAPKAPQAEPPAAPEPEPAAVPSAATRAISTPSPSSPPPDASAGDPLQAAPATPQPAASPPAARAPASSAAAQNAAPGATAPVGSSGAASEYGQDALAAATASFAKAFTRAVPRIASADRVWHGLGFGSAGSAVFKIELDAQGKVVGQGTVLDEPPPAAHLARIIGRTVLLLRNQTFAVAPEAGAPTSQRFELSAEIRQVAALDDGVAEPEDLRQIGRLVEPTRVRPGKANFTYNSGRQVELTVRFLNP